MEGDSMKGVMSYLVKEKKMDAETAKSVMDRIFAHPDIYMAFEKWIEVRNYDKVDLEISGYKLKDVASTMSYMSAPVIFSYMAWLAEDPVAAVKDMKLRKAAATNTLRKSANYCVWKNKGNAETLTS